jgi:hypothetical protein
MDVNNGFCRPVAHDDLHAYLDGEACTVRVVPRVCANHDFKCTQSPREIRHLQKLMRSSMEEGEGCTSKLYLELMSMFGT